MISQNRYQKQSAFRLASELGISGVRKLAQVAQVAEVSAVKSVHQSAPAILYDQLA